MSKNAYRVHNNKTYGSHDKFIINLVMIMLTIKTMIIDEYSNSN